jgi:hypothetical protein
MIVFYPKASPRWGDVFDFDPPVTLTPKHRNNFKTFGNRYELIDFLKQHGVSLTDGLNPLIITDSDDVHPQFGEHISVVHQNDELLGWLKEYQ